VCVCLWDVKASMLFIPEFWFVGLCIVQALPVSLFPAYMTNYLLICLPVVWTTGCPHSFLVLVCCWGAMWTSVSARAVPRWGLGVWAVDSYPECAHMDWIWWCCQQFLFVWLNGGVSLVVSDLLWWFELTAPAFVLIFTTRMYWRAFFRVCDNCESWVTIESWVTTVCHGWQLTFVGDNCPSWATTAIVPKILFLLHLLSSVFFFSTFLKACSIWLKQFVFILFFFFFSRL